MFDKRILNRILKAYKGKNILITGGRGYLGTNLVSLLKNIDCQIIRLDKIGTNSIKQKRSSKIQDIVGDISQSGILEKTLCKT